MWYDFLSKERQSTLASSQQQELFLKIFSFYDNGFLFLENLQLFV